VALFTALILAGGGHSYAATTATVGGNALRIAPVRVDLTVQPGAMQTVDVFVQNMTSSTATLQAIVNDFTAGNNEDGQPNILLNGQEAPSHSLKQFVAPISNFTLAANEQKDIKVSVAIPKGTAGGGYYGVVRFAPATNTHSIVNLSASVGSLILVKVPGNITEKINIASFDVRGKDDKPATFFTSGKSLNAIVRFQNPGNVQEEPFGKVVLKKGGKQVALYEVNNTDPRGNILPESIRRFSVPLTKVGSIGKYTIDGDFGYGTNGQLLTASKTFYIVPVGAIAAVVVALALIAFAIFGLPRMLRSYNRRVIQKAQRAQKR